MPIQSAKDLLAVELSDIRDAEQQAAKALQEMSRQADDEELQQMLERRLQEGQRILKEADNALQQLQAGTGSQSSAASAIIQKGRDIVEEAGTPEMKRAVMISVTQKLQHYCIAAWGTVRALAREVGARDLEKAMEQGLDEGKRWDEEMSDLAESRVNPEALER